MLAVNFLRYYTAVQKTCSSVAFNTVMVICNLGACAYYSFVDSFIALVLYPYCDGQTVVVWAVGQTGTQATHLQVVCVICCIVQCFVCDFNKFVVLYRQKKFTLVAVTSTWSCRLEKGKHRGNYGSVFVVAHTSYMLL